MTAPSRRRRSEDGAVIVEFALISPLLFALLFGFLEVGLLVLGSSIGTNAAREGARVGILQYLDADDDASAAHTAIEDAVRSKLADLVDTDDITVEVRCLDYDEVQADEADPSKDCAASGTNRVEAGRDLLEVAVTWRPLVITGFVGPEVRTDRARMTIVSRTPGGADATAPDGSSLPQLTLDCAPSSLTETNSSQQVTCTIHRSTLTGNPSVTFLATDGTATNGSDYSAPSGTVVTFSAGSAYATVNVTVLGDTSFEATEDFTLSLVGPNGAVLGSPSSETITIANDDPADSSPPTVTSIRLEDSRVPNGKVDTIRVLLSEPAGSCAGNGFTVSGLPSGYGQGSVTVTGSAAVIQLTEGSSHVTSVGAIRVSYTASASGVCDGAGNPLASFSNATPVDVAAPYLVSITSANAAAGTARRPDADDRVTFTFTEPMQAPAGGNVVFQRDNGSSKPTSLTVGSLVPAASLDTGSANWFAGNGNPGGTATFASSTATSGNDIVVTLGSCTGSCSLQEGPATVTLPAFSWASAPRDLAGNAAPNAVAPPATAVPFTGLVLF